MKEKAVFLICSFWAMFCISATGKTIYVDDDAAGANDGSSWENAYIYLQDALADADSAEKPVEIRVAQGIYKPDQGSTQTPGDREATFHLMNQVTLKGGYAGLNEMNPNECDIEKYQTILSGDLANDDISWDQLLEIRALKNWWFDEPNREDNTYHVITGCNIDETAMLDGFSIENGCCPLSFDSFGGGLFVDSGNPTVLNCNFKRNSALIIGGAIGCINNSNPALINCIVTRNWALDIGGMYNSNSNPSLTNCIFSENFTEIPTGVIVERGYFPCGGMRNSNSEPKLINCSFINNSPGAMRNYGSNPIINNCTFIKNKGGRGGITNYSDSNPILINCTLFGNSTEYYKEISNHYSNSVLINCIVWGNIPDLIDEDTIVSYSNIQGGWEGEGNIDIYPLFADPNNDDYHLKSQAGRWDPNSQSWVQDDVTSPCIDAGDPNSPIGLEPFPNGGIINMGAYGGTAQTSKSYFGEPVCETIVAGDINGDCKVNILDLEIMLLHWLEDNSY